MHQSNQAPKTDPKKPEERFSQLIFIGLAVLCLAIYGQTAWFDYINIDDHSYVYKNSKVLAGINGDSIKWAFTAFHSSNWHPLTWLSHMFDVSLFGTNPGAFHVVNVLLHLVNSILSFAVFRSLTGDIWKSAMVAFIFAVHPTHVESVAWISERKDVLSTAFWLLTMLAYVRYAKLETPKIFSTSYLLVAVFFVLGLLSKPMLVTLPFALLLLDYWPLNRLIKLRDLPSLFLEKLPLIVLAAISSAITLSAQRSSGAVSSLTLVPIDVRLSNATIAYAKYIDKFFYPVDLSFFYPIKFTFETWQLALASVVLIAISAFCWLQRSEQKFLMTGWLWFIGTLVPVIGIVQVGSQSMADRYTYIPYFGLSIMTVWTAADLARRLSIPNKFVKAFCGIVILALTMLCFWQTSYWKNSETLYSHSIAVTENNSFLKTQLCSHYAQNLQIIEAEKKCSELLNSVLDLADAQIALGLVRYQAGKFDQAASNFQNALKMRPDSSAPHYHLAAAYFSLGRLDESISSFERSVSLYDGGVSATDMAVAAELLGNECLKRNDRTRAQTLFEQALRFDPTRAEAKRRLAELRAN